MHTDYGSVYCGSQHRNTIRRYGVFPSINYGVTAVTMSSDRASSIASRSRAAADPSRQASPTGLRIHRNRLQLSLLFFGPFIKVLLRVQCMNGSVVGYLTI